MCMWLQAREWEVWLLARSLLVLVLISQGAWAQEPKPSLAGATLTDDPVLAGLVREALDKRPEIAQARSTLQANLERAPQGGALPDPIVSLALQNEGFRGIQTNQTQMSWMSVVASQTFPWYGKRELRTEVLALGARQSEADVKRTRMSVRADVERAYVDLLLVRDQLALQAKLERLWTQAEGFARARYESGDGAQSDILRARLQLSRLKQRRWALAAAERRSVVVLNRLRSHPPSDTVATNRSLMSMPDPVLPTATRAVGDAEAGSPELQKARLGVEMSGRLQDLARKDMYPDVTVTAGVMPRWGKFDSMWVAGVSFSIPLWSKSKQSRAVAETEWRGTAAQSGAEAVRLLLLQRINERLALLEALVESNRLYRSGLLEQSEATASSTLVQYQSGRVSFASVLDALSGYVADLDGFYESVAAAQRVDIAQRELSLEAAGPTTPGAMGSSPIPGAAATDLSPSGMGPLQPAGGSSSGSMSRM